MLAYETRSANCRKTTRFQKWKWQNKQARSLTHESRFRTGNRVWLFWEPLETRPKVQFDFSRLETKNHTYRKSMNLLDTPKKSKFKFFKKIFIYLFWFLFNIVQDTVCKTDFKFKLVVKLVNFFVSFWFMLVHTAIVWLLSNKIESRE